MACSRKPRDYIMKEGNMSFREKWASCSRLRKGVKVRTDVQQL
jgi:hypothetical protein